MNRFVHFMVRDPDDQDAIIYPTQLRQEGYLGFGEFYLLGMDASLLDSYVFAAIKDESVLLVDLIRTGAESRLYKADVPDVGSFIFQAYHSRKPARYSGGDARLDGYKGVRVLKARKPKDNDAAARQYNFYFVGYSPRISDMDQ